MSINPNNYDWKSIQQVEGVKRQESDFILINSVLRQCKPHERRVPLIAGLAFIVATLACCIILSKGVTVQANLPFYILIGGLGLAASSAQFHKAYKYHQTYQAVLKDQRDSEHPFLKRLLTRTRQHIDSKQLDVSLKKENSKERINHSY